MTGFARVRRLVPEGEIVLTIKSVNHRGLDLHFHLPAELDPFETVVRSAIKERVARGHLQIHLQFNRTRPVGAEALNRPLLEAWLGAFAGAARDYSLENKPDLNAALQVPGMFQCEAALLAGEELEPVLLEATREALDLLDQFREREGAAITREMHQRSGTIRDLVGRMEQIRSKAVPSFQKRLNERLRDLLHGAGIDSQRLAQEAALLVDRSDVSEELVRLKTHAGQVETLLTSTGEVGKKLDFLLQEMNREANTILSKTGGLGDLGLTITDLALAAKAEIDKIREQSLNLE
jgi:uncharacterized protein (TIGR00255 family)